MAVNRIAKAPKRIVHGLRFPEVSATAPRIGIRIATTIFDRATAAPPRKFAKEYDIPSFIPWSWMNRRTVTETIPILKIVLAISYVVHSAMFKGVALS
ncbi:hypothetical protein ES703_121442 [subsurface metagenome]